MLLMAMMGAGGAAYGPLPTGGEDEAPNTSSSITLTVKTDGTWTVTGTTLGLIASGSWITPNGLATGDYHIRMEANTGSFDSGTTGSDLALTSNRSWTLTQSGMGDKSVTFTISLKNASGGTVLASANGSMSVSVLA